jgi:hypothetical protein
LYVYVGNNPVSFIDPWGTIVVGVFDRETGILLFADSQTGQTVTAQFFSGTGEYRNRPEFETLADAGPIPAGDYEILFFPNDDFYRLDAMDGTRNDVFEQFGRDKFRLHKPGRSIGCITAETESDWKKVKNLVENTKTEEVPDWVSKWKRLLLGRTIKRYGYLRVL